MATITQLRKEQLADSRIEKRLQELIQLAQSGEILGLLVVVTRRNETYEYDRIGPSLLEAIGLHERAIYKLHIDWDKLS